MTKSHRDYKSRLHTLTNAFQHLIAMGPSTADGFITKIMRPSTAVGLIEIRPSTAACFIELKLSKAAGLI